MFDDLPSDDQPEGEGSPAAQNNLDADADWAADQLAAYQLEFFFMDGEDAAAVGELARFSAPVPLIAILATRVLLPGSRSSTESSPPFALTLYPERIVARAASGGVVSEAQTALPRRSAVRAAGVAFSLPARAVAALFGGQGKARLNWREQEVVQWRLVGRQSEKVGGFLGLSSDLTRLHLSAEELIASLPLPKTETAELAPHGSLTVLGRALGFANVFRPKDNRFGVIEVNGGVARAASWDGIVEYVEPGLDAFDLAVHVNDVAAVRSVLKRLKGNVRISRDDEHRFIFNSADMTVAVSTSDVVVPKIDVARANAESGLKISISTFELVRLARPMLALSKRSEHLVRFEVRDGPGGRELHLVGQTPEAHGWSPISIVPTGSEPELDRAFIRADTLVRMVDPGSFDAAELYLGSHAGVLKQYRGEASLTHIFAYAPPPR
ncbi:hypothetical protein GCM10022280_27690 [Sphingomonas swuensis]|uniref:Uncharacterized protein n=1 Tax=Sphingomonas swuensis TaxID=977800 RepID=A0ABP7TF40_9SPHN